MKSVVVKSVLLLVALLSIPGGSVMVKADQNVALAWDPSPDKDITGYNVYYSQVGGTVTNQVSMPNSTRGSVSGLAVGATYFMYVTAVNSAGTESPPSNFLNYQVTSAPQLAVIADQTVAEGSLLQVKLSATQPSVPSPVLTYSIVSAPAGATLDPVSGVFSWTPTEAQGPSASLVTVQVADNSSPPLTDTKSFTVAVTEVNTAPTLAPIPDQAVLFGNTVTVQLAATDTDLPANSLTYSVVSGPAGASVASTSGLFTWTANQVPSPGTYVVTVQVSDNGTPSLSASRIFRVIVTSPNTAPALATVPNLFGTVGSPVTWQLSATDSDVPAQTLLYNLVSGPSGAAVNPTTGLFSWTPIAVTSGVSVTVQVTDNGTPALSVSRTFTVAIVAANTTPTLAAVPNQTVTLGNTLSVQLSATDSDTPAQTLTYSLMSGPSGAVVNPTTGLFSWTPTQVSSGVSVTVLVTDNGNPPLSSSRTFTVTVVAPNTAPTLAAVPNQTVTLGNTLNLQLTATDSDVPAQTLTYSLMSGPAGAIVTSGGAFSWKPTQASSGTSVTVLVTDNGNPPLSSSRTFTVTVVAPNTPPSLTAVSTQTVTAGSTLHVQLTATDSDVPAQTLSYVLVSGPAGASVSPSGLFSWTPAVSQLASTSNVSVAVTDNGSPQMSDTKSFTVMVQPSNTAPVLASVATQTVPVGTLLSVQLSATDSDVPAQTLVYSLVAGPSGASVSPTGLFTWTPSASSPSSTNSVTVSVTDNGTPALSNTKTFTVIAVKGNTPPILAAIGNQTIPELKPFSLQLSAVDSDLPAQTLTYSLLAGPSGATLNPSTGLFSWTPTEAQGPSSNTVTVQVTDSGAPALSATRSFTIVVTEVNSAPRLAPVPDQYVSAGDVVMLAMSATDSDLPANKLTYSMVSGPSGAKVDSTTGVLTWRLLKSAPPSSNPVTIVVTDNGVPALSGTVTFNIIVAGKKAGSAAKITNMETVSWLAELEGGHTVRFTYPLAANKQSGQWSHYLEASEDLVHWETLGMVSDLAELRDTDAAGAPHRFYRIRSEQSGMVQAPDSSTIASE